MFDVGFAVARGSTARAVRRARVEERRGRLLKAAWRSERGGLVAERMGGGRCAGESCWRRRKQGTVER
jgi:hypothetical protein